MKSRKFATNHRDIIIIAHNIRSLLNVGAILRSAEGFGVSTVFATGWTPSPDHGLPHVRKKLASELHKTALGAEAVIDFSYKDDVKFLLESLKQDGYRIVGLEQNARSISLPEYQAPAKIALILGEEVNGITSDLLEICDDLIEIPMFGQKESFNVSVAAGIALYQLII